MKTIMCGWLLVVIFMLGANLGCNNEQNNQKSIIASPCKVDSLQAIISSQQVEHLKKEEKLMTVTDSLKSANDTLRKKLFLSNYKVEKVRFYLHICLKNSSQDKFLKGWIRRAVE